MQFDYLLLLIIGLLCLFVPQYIASFLPYLLGAGMVFSGILAIIKWSRHTLEDKRKNSESLAHGLVLLIMGASFIIQGESSLVSLGIVWAIIGIVKSVHPLVQLIDNAQSHKPALLSGFDFVIRLGLALLLLFDPYGKFTPHLRILGLELIVSHFQLTGKNKNREKSE